ncbi:MAG: caspase family protein [Sphingobacteriales bacterium]
MKKIYTYLGLIVFFIITIGSLHAQTLIYQDSFIPGQTKWENFSSGNTSGSIDAGKYLLTQKSNGNAFKTLGIAIETNKNYSIETEVVHVSGTSEFSMGLVFASKDRYDNYYFAISASGSYTLRQRQQGFLTPIIDWTYSPLIKTADGLPNKLRIEKSDGLLKMYINDQLVSQLSMPVPMGNQIGFCVENAQSVAFGYLTVNYLNNPAKDTVKKTTGEIAKVVVNKPPVETAQVIISKPVDIPVKDTAKKTAGEVVKVIVNKPVDTLKKPSGEIAKVIINKPNDQPAKDTVKKTAGEITNVVVNKPNDQPVKDTVKKTAGEITNVIVNKPNDQPAKDTVKKTTGEITNVIVNKPNAEAVKDTANKTLSASVIETPYHFDFNFYDQSQWASNPVDSALIRQRNGVLKISGAADRYTSRVTDPKLYVNMHRDFLLETETIHKKGKQDNGYGLDFAVDSLRQYHFWIIPGGYYCIGYTKNSNSDSLTPIVPFTPTDAVNKRGDAKNKLAIEHKNGQLYFYINDQRVDNYPDVNFSGHQFGVSVDSKQDVEFDYLTFGYLDKPEPIIKKDTFSIPKIYITSPEVTRGLRVVQNSEVLHVAGVAKDPAGIFSVRVNDVSASVDSLGNFTAEIPMALGDNPLRVTVLNMNMTKGTYTFHVARSSISAVEQTSISQSASQGKFYALLIGVQDYRDQRIPTLEGPVNDADSLSQVLVANYTFLPENIKVLKNPTKEALFDALDSLSGKVKSEDNLLIFYGGHGLYDNKSLQGFWFPADAVRDKKVTWISNSDLLGYITEIKSKHTLLISDACFSGSIFKSRSVELMPRDIQQLYNLPSRKAMTSGTMNEVPDKSVFMQYLVKRLKENKDPFMTSEFLFSILRPAVINNSPTFQVPQFGEIREAGDEGGDFIFIKKVKNPL